MKLSKILRSSLPVVFVHIATVGHGEASDSLPSIDSIYNSVRVKSAPEIMRPLPPVIRPIAVKPKPAVRKSEPAVVIAPQPIPAPPPAPRREMPKPTVSVTKLKIAVEAKTQKPKVASPDSLNNPAVARQIDPSKFSLFGPQSQSFRYDPRMVRAMEIASSRAYGHSQGSCWRYVKNALLTAGLVDSRPTTAYAKEAAYELTTKYGFRRIACSNPYEAPIGSVLVYGGAGAGHVEFRTRSGFVSDFTTTRPSKRPLIGVYVK